MGRLLLRLSADVGPGPSIDHFPRRLPHAPEKQAASSSTSASEGVPGRLEPVRGQHREAVRPVARRDPLGWSEDTGVDGAQGLEWVRAGEEEGEVLISMLLRWTTEIGETRDLFFEENACG